MGHLAYVETLSFNLNIYPLVYIANDCVAMYYDEKLNGHQ